MSKTLKIFLSVILVLVMTTAVLSGCSSNNQSSEQNESSQSSQESSQSDQAQMPTEDRAGNPINLEKYPEKIISLAPSNTQQLIELGLKDKLIAVDLYSAGIEGVDQSLPQFDIMAPDAEAIIALEPDVIFVTGMSIQDDNDPFKVIVDAGINVLYIPSSNSIEGIIKDYEFIAAVTGTQDKCKELTDNFNAELEKYKEMGAAQTEKKKVYFEIAPAPNMCTFGKGTFLNEIIEILGAQNAFADSEGWVTPTDELIVASDPDVIFTNVNYIDDPLGELTSREAFADMKAIKEGKVYQVPTDASSRPTYGIIEAMEIMSQVLCE